MTRPSQPQPLPSGRARVTLCLRPQVLDALRAEAERLDRSMSAVVDRMLHERLVEEGEVT